MAAGLGRLIVRGVAGGLMAGHGAQKLFGSFDGPGLEGVTGMMRGMKLEPAQHWARLAGASEFGGGLLTALGFMHPAGPLATIGAMSMASRTMHWGKPIWNASGGAELPVLFMAIAAEQIVSGPGPIALDTILRSRLPGWTVPVGLAVTAGAVYYAVEQSKKADSEIPPTDAAEASES
ncbi:MAG TPA: DoxX family protein [Thermomicrobiales bacterium]|nr:DoxX family protein [Thermomicrobiales bacterium]